MMYEWERRSRESKVLNELITGRCALLGWMGVGESWTDFYDEENRR